jgi:hypothetical protein
MQLYSIRCRQQHQHPDGSASHQAFVAELDSTISRKVVDFSGRTRVWFSMHGESKIPYRIDYIQYTLISAI